MDNDRFILRQGGDSKRLRPDEIKDFRVPRGPAVILCNPKFPHNVGTIIRACSCYGIKTLIYSGNRVSIDHREVSRLPREERMKGYHDVTVINYDLPFDILAPGSIPIAIELLEKCETLPLFSHPGHQAVYVFGPEDGSIPGVWLRHCHRFVSIPARHCLNLAAAVYTVLYARQAQHMPSAHAMDLLNEERGLPA